MEFHILEERRVPSGGRIFLDFIGNTEGWLNAIHMMEIQ
jgi:hypothetical protein